MKLDLQPDGSIRIYPVRWKLYPMLLGALGFVALGFFILGWRETLLPIRLYHAGAAVLAIVFFGLCALVILARILRHSPVVLLSHQGITDQTSPFAIGFVSWEEIAFLSIYTIEKQPMLGLHLKDPDSIMARVGRAKAGYMKLNRRMGFAPMNIPQILMPIPLEELAELIRTRYGVRRELSERSQTASSRSKNDR